MPIIGRLTKRPADESESRKPAPKSSAKSPSEPVELCHDPLGHELLQLYNEQVDHYYSLPEKKRPKQGMTFSPSEAALCPRQLFYMFINEQPDEPQPRRPLRTRIPDVGHGLHELRQKHLNKMPTVLDGEGFIPKFRVKPLEEGPAIEASFEKEIQHKGESFKIRGRLDAILEFYNEDGEYVGDVVWDLKAKTLKRKLSQLDRENKKYIPQMVCYYILTDIRFALIEYESAQKDWGKDDPNGDVRRVIIEITESMAKKVLDKFAYVTACVRTGTVPEMERDDYYCANLCPFAGACHRDNQANLESARS